MLKENQPLTADNDKMRKLGNNLWYFKGKFLIKVIESDDTPVYFIYNKYEEGKGKDLCFFTKNLTSLKNLMMILNEEIAIEICTDLLQ